MLRLNKFFRKICTRTFLIINQDYYEYFLSKCRVNVNPVTYWLGFIKFLKCDSCVSLNSQRAGKIHVCIVGVYICFRYVTYTYISVIICSARSISIYVDVQHIYES